MKRTRYISILVSIVMLFACNSLIANASAFIDVNGDEYYAKAAEELSIRGILSGYDDGKFKPERSITRAEMARLVCGLKGDYALQDAEEMIFRDFELPFFDVNPEHWAMPYILYASQCGIINGYDDGSFKPEAPVTYEEAVKMIVCALGLDIMVFSYPEDWAKGYIEAAENFGITKDCHCQRGWFANRSHVAVMMYNSVIGMELGFSYAGDSETDSGYQDEYYDDEYYNDEYYDEYYDDEYYGDEYYEDEYYEDEYYDDEYYDDEYDDDEYDDEEFEEDYGTRGPGEYLLTFEKSDVGVIEADAGYYKPGEKISIDAYGDEDHKFMSWSSDNGGEFYNVFKHKTTFTMPANDVVISASYIAVYGVGDDDDDDSDALDRYDGQNINLNKYVRLNMKMIGCGTYRDLSGPYHPGQEVELRIGAEDEDIFLGWSSDDVELPTPNSPKCKIIIPDHDVTVTATFSN